MVAPATIKDLLALHKLSENEFESVCLPERMGNTAPIAYGGCTIGIAIPAAYQTVPPGYHAYSILGHYLGPASTERKLRYSIRRVRDTRSFATRHVEVSQIQDDGSSRLCAFLAVDFQTQEPKELMRYSTPPRGTVQHWSKEKSTPEWREMLVAEGKMHPKMAEAHVKTFGMSERFFEDRACAGSFLSQTGFGMLKDARTNQEHLPLTERTSQRWLRSRSKLETPGEQLGAVTFLTDGALAFVGLTHDHKFLDDAGACSSLDFALRLLSNKIDFNQWHLHEMLTIAAGEGRTYAECRLWDEDGNMVASMTQEGILRPKPEPKAKGKSNL